MVGVQKVIANLDRAAREMPGALERGVSRASILTRREVVRQLSGEGDTDPFFGKKGARSPFLGHRTGLTRSHITPGGQVFRSGDTVFSAVGSPDKYVKLHEEGGTIQGRQFLRIPLASAQSGSGAERQEFAGRSLRDIPGVFLRRSRSGKLFAMREAGGARSRRVEFLYLLVRSVRMPARHMFETVRDRVAPAVNALVGGEVSVVTRKANNG